MSRSQRAAVTWIMTFVFAVSPMAVYAQAPAADAAGAPTAIDLSMVTPGAALAIVARPARVLADPSMRMLPTEVISAVGKKELGIDPLDVESLVAFLEPPGPNGPPGAGVVVRFSKPFSLDALTDKAKLGAQLDELNGQPIFRAQQPTAPSFMMVGDRTLIVAHNHVLPLMLERQGKPNAGPAVDILSKVTASGDVAAVLAVDKVRDLAKAQMQQVDLPPPLEGLRKLPDLVDRAAARVRLTGRQDAALAIFCPDEASAAEVEQVIEQAIAVGRQMVAAQIAQMGGSDDEIELAMGQYLTRISEEMFTAVRPTRQGDRLVISGSGQENQQMATIGILISLLLPAVQSARSAARRAVSTNNLKQIALAMHNHHDTRKKLPSRTGAGEDGKPLLSWRVHLLPYLEQNGLYDQFKLDEPWDSPHNKKLVERMPAIYRSPTSVLVEPKTNYVVPVGKGTLFEGTKGIGFAKITDGTSNTVMAVEVPDESAVIWTKPDDWEVDMEKPMKGLGPTGPGVFNVVFADGSVRFIPMDIGADTWKAVLTMSGGEPVDLP